MPTVRCDVSEGLRDSDRTVGVRGVDGGTAYLRVRRDFLSHEGTDAYLPVGVVMRDGDRVLIELPEEADNGANRVWVAASDFRVFETTPARAAA